MADVEAFDGCLIEITRENKPPRAKGAGKLSREESVLDQGDITAANRLFDEWLNGDALSPTGEDHARFFSQPTCHADRAIRIRHSRSSGSGSNDAVQACVGV